MPNGFELSRPARTFSFFSRLSFKIHQMQFAQPAGSAAAKCYAAIRSFDVPALD